MKKRADPGKMPLGWSAAGRSMLILLMLWFQLGPSIMMVAANPVGEQVIAGGATFDRAGSTLTVNQGTDKVIINWQDFSIGAGEITNFIQPSSTAAALNRVVSQNVSEIYGTLNANGQIYLINPNGLVVGATGVINTQSFIASTHDVSNAEFLAGGDLTFKSQNPKSKIQNLGAISADGGDIILIAQEVENAGNLSAPNGTVALAAGTEVLVKASDEERVFIQAATDDSKFEISNSGLISSATAELKAVGGNEFALAINNSGVIRATRAVTEKGRVFLRAVGGKVRQAGEIIASSAGGETGGEIQISGEDIELADGSLTDASGTASGGSIQVGGGLRGEQLGDFENARMVTAQQGAQLKADGGDGLVILWSDGTTVYEGDISADGQGFVEVSGKEYLTFQGTVNTGGGELWLDPFNYTIGTTEAAAIVAALASSNVTINTNNDVSGFGSSGNSSDAGDIIINADIIYQSSRNLTFLAIGDIEVNAAVQNLNGDGEINMVAGWTGSGSFNANTFTNADVTSTTLYGNGNGSVFIGSASSSVPVAVGSREGTTRVFGHDIILRGGNSADALAMIGLQTTQAQAIDGTNLQALTGQGSIPITGDIITRSTNDTTLQAGTANFTYAQIGHGGREASITVVTDIDMAVGGNLDVLSGTGGGSNVAYSQIGNGGWRARGLFSIPQGGDITISYVGGNLTMRGGDRGASSAQIGGGGIQSDHIYDGNISITNVQGNVTLTSGARARSGVFIGYGGIDNTGSGDPGGGDITLEALGNLTLTAASARGNIALVGHSSGLTELFGDVTVTIGGDVVLTGSGSNIAGIGHSAQPRSSGTLEATGDVMVQVDGNITMDRAAIGHANDTTSGNTFIGVEGDITTTANAEFSSALAADGGELRLYVGGSDLVNTAATLNGIAHGDDPLPNNQGDFAFGTGTYTAEFSYYAAQTLYNYIIDAAAALEIVNALTLGDVTIDYTLDQSLFGAIEDTDGGTQFIQIDSGITFGSDFLFSFLTTGDITVDAAIEGGGGDLTFESITMGDITINADIQLTSLAAGSGPDGSISFTTQDGDILVNSGTISTVGGGDSAGGGDITFTTMTDGNVVTIGSGEGGTGALVQTAHGVVSINTTQLNFDDATPIQTDGKTTDRTNGGLVDLTGVSSVVIDLEPTLSPLGDPRTVTIDTDVGDDGTGGDIQFAEDGEISASSLASNSDRRLILDTSGSAAAGNVSLSEVGDGDAGEFLQQVHIFATDGSSGGGVLVLNGDILLDDDGSGNASSFSFNGTSVVLSSSVTIDTEQGDTSGVNGGNVDFGDATFSADTAGFDISIDTSTTQNVTSGNIMVGSFTDDDAGGLGGFFVNDITFDAFNELVGTDGVITTGSQIFLDTDGTATGGGEVTILGSWQLSQSVSIDTNQVTAGLLNAGNMDFRFATISATTADVDLTIDSTAVTSANANGGQVRFGVIDDSGGSLIRNITFVTAGGDSGGEGGNLDLHAGIEISGTFDATTRDIRFRNATNSRLDTPASITAGSVVLRAIKNEAGGTPDIEMEDSGTSNTFITSTSGAIELEAEGDVQLMEVNSADNLTVTAGETILLGDDVTSVGTQSFSNTALLLTDVTVDGAGISFDGTVDSSSGNNFSLTVNDSGTTVFAGAVGETDALASLATDAGGTTQINGGAVTTTGDQTYEDAVQVDGATVLTMTGAGGDLLLAAGLSTTDADTDLTLLARGDITINGSIKYDGTGSIHAVAGWDGSTAFDATTFLAEDVATTILFGNSDGSIIIGDGSQSAGISVGSRNGSTNLFADDVTLTAGNGTDNNVHAQIGFHATDEGASYVIGGDINVLAAGDVTASAAETGTFGFVQIGHVGGQSGTANTTAEATVTDANIRIDTGGSVRFLGGNDDTSTLTNTGSYAQVGHGGYSAYGDFGGTITVRSEGSMEFSAGDVEATYVQLGHGGQFVEGSYSGAITITKVNDLTFDAGAGDDTSAQLGHGGVSAVGNHSGNITLTEVTGNLDFTAGDGEDAYSQLGHGGLFASGNHSGDITITEVDDSVVFAAGGGESAFVQLGHGGQSVIGDQSGAITIGTISGDFTFTAGDGDDAYSQLGHGGTFAGGSHDGAIRITSVTGELSFTGGEGDDTYAHLGHGGSSLSGNMSGTIDIGSVDGSLSFNGGDGEDSYAQLGHGGRSVDGTHSGAITITQVDESLVFTGGDEEGGYSQLGHGGALADGNHNGSITITRVGENIEFYGGTNEGTYSHFGHGGFLVAGDLSGAITITEVEENVEFFGGSGEDAYSQLGHGGEGVIGGHSGVMMIESIGGDLDLGGGSGADAYAQLGHGGRGVTGDQDGEITLTRVEGDLELSAGSAGDTYAQIGHGGVSANGNFSGDIDITVTGSADLTGVDADQYALIGHGNTPGGVDVGQNRSGDVQLKVVNDINLTTAAVGHLVDSGGSYTSGNTYIGVFGNITADSGTQFNSAPASNSGELRFYVGGADNVDSAALLNGVAHGGTAFPNNLGDFAFGQGPYVPGTSGVSGPVVAGEFNYYGLLGVYSYLVEAAEAANIVADLAAGDVSLDSSVNEPDYGAFLVFDNTEIRIDADINYDSTNVLSFITDGEIILNAPITNINAGAPNDAVVISGSSFTNNQGSNAINLTSGRWLIYLDAVDGNTFGGLDSGNQAIWNTAYPTAVTQTGNRYVFAEQPTLTFTTTDDTKTYGDDFTTDIQDNFTVSGFVDASTYGNVFTQDTLANTTTGTAVADSTGAAATAAVAGSPYTVSIDVSGVTATTGYAIATDEDGELTVDLKALTITADDQSKTYGDTFSFAGTEFTTNGLVNTDTVTGADLSSTGAAATATVAGSPYTINISNAVGTGLDNYDITFETGELTVNLRALTITADDQTKTYGDAFTFAGTEFTTSGLVNSDTVTGADLTSTGAAATATVAGSPYTINISNAVGTGLANYDITFETGELAVDPKALTITADDQTKTYGDTFTFAGTEFTTNGLVNSDTVTGADLTSTGAAATATVAGSPYTINISNAAGTGLANYTITFETGELTVDPKALTITADDQTKTYGDTFTFAGTEFTTNGLVNSDTVTGADLSSTGAVNTANVAGSPYSINISNAVGTGLANYTVSFVTGELTVDARDITVTAVGGSSTYGDSPADPGLSATNLASFDDASDLTGLSNSFGIGSTTAAGNYTLTVDGTLTNTNYNVTGTVNGLWTVDPKALTITADDQTKIYGDAFTFAGTEFTTNGLINGDTVTSADLTSTGAVATATVAGSPYDINISNAVGSGLANYTITFETGELTVQQRNITITADAGQNKIYGDADPALTFTVGGLGLVNGDTTSGSLQRDPGENVGNYTINQGTLDAGNNYNITYVSDLFAITPRAIEVTAGSGSSVFGDSPANPGISLTGGSLGFSDTLDGIGLGNDFAVDATTPAGTYVIAVTGDNANYNITKVDGSWTVDLRSLILTALDQRKALATTFTFTGTEFSSSGLQGTDTVGSVRLTSPGAAFSVGAGNYPISISDASGGTFDPNNYDITFVPGNLEVFVTDAISNLTVEQQNALAPFLDSDSDFDLNTEERLLKFLNSDEGRLLFEGETDKEALERILLWLSSFDIAAN